METWVNIRDLGAKGDGETDDTEVFEKAVSLHKNIYVPQGWYRLTRTLKLSPGTKLIGLHPFGTQFLLKESEPAFSGFGVPDLSAYTREWHRAHQCAGGISFPVC